MKLGFHARPPAERHLFIKKAALGRSLSLVALEKDFWMCWLLGMIDSVSDDNDLSLSPAILGLPEEGQSRNQANKWMKNAEVACGAAVKSQIAPAFARGRLFNRRMGAI